MFPGCIRGPGSDRGSSEELQERNNTIIQVYTDWANHYLEKGRSKRRINSLATDCCDGVLLAEVIESVINQQIPDVNRKPKSASQMLDNINACLNVLRANHVPGVDQLSSTDLRDGRLKAILALFFALSRYKQQTKQRSQQHHMAPNRHASIGAPERKPTGTHIPLPGGAPPKRCPPDKIRPVQSSTRAASPQSLIPRGAPSPAGQPRKQANSMLEKIGLFKNGDRSSTNRRASSSSGVSSARSERSDSSVNTESTKKGQKIAKADSIRTPSSAPVSRKTEIKAMNGSVGNPGLVRPQVKAVPNVSIPTPGTGIPKPTAAVKGTSKVSREERPLPPTPVKNHPPASRENSQVNLKVSSPAKQAVALVSPMPSEQLSESSTSTGRRSNSSDTSVVFKPSESDSSRPTPPPYKSEGEVNNHERCADDGDEGSPMRITPMRPLLRGYAATLTLPGRTSDMGQLDASLSDGELSGQSGVGGVDGFGGYMSEGGDPRGNGTQIRQQLVNGVGGLSVLAQQQAARRGRVEETPPPRTSASSRNRAGDQQWKRYVEHANGANPPPPPAPGSPTASRRERRQQQQQQQQQQQSWQQQPQHKNSSSSSSRAATQSFGYVKRSSTGATTNGTQVSAVPRTKVKVSGGTQTCSSDLQPHKAAPQVKSCSLTGNSASQLSQAVRERLLLGSQSLPKAVVQDRGPTLRQNRPKASDGSLSDTQAADPTGPYAPWIRHSNTYSVAPRLAETDSLESLASLPGHRGSLAHARLLRESPSRLSRSNSIRSTKSEKLYPSMLHRNAEQDVEPYYCLPTGTVLSHWSQPTSPAPGQQRTFPLSPTHSAPRHSIPKNDDIHGSSVSLVSTASSLYSSAEEKQAHEIRKLRRELMDAQEKVHTLTSQLSTNAHVVSAFEQSLSSMTQRLQHLTATAERKDSELTELRTAMETLRAQSAQAGIGTGLARQPSCDSVSSLSSACSLDKQDKRKKKGWLRSSFTKAFSRNAKITRVSSGQSPSNSDTCGSNESRRAASPSPPASLPHDSTEVAELQKQLREKDLVLTDIRLEALSSAHQLESLKDTVMKMRNEMMSLKQNNERLQRMVGGGISDASTGVEDEPEIEGGRRVTVHVFVGPIAGLDRHYDERYGSTDGAGAGSDVEMEVEIGRVTVGAGTTWSQLDSSLKRCFRQHISWLEAGGGGGGGSLGLNADVVVCYRLGDARRGGDGPEPELLPCAYTIGDRPTAILGLTGAAALAFGALVPLAWAERLSALSGEGGRVVLCGPAGSGKTWLASKLAEWRARSQGRDPAEAVATFAAGERAATELRRYLQQLAELPSHLLPAAVILDDLHRVGRQLAEALAPLPRRLSVSVLGTMRASSGAAQAAAAASLQLQHGFRWVQVAAHMEPVRGLVGRALRRRLHTLELECGPQPQLAAVLTWLPRVWHHLNTFLETHGSGDVAISPRLFLSCPLDAEAAEAWFSDTWNYTLAPHLREAAEEGLQMYGRRAAFTDPAQFILDTFPWPTASPSLARISPADVGINDRPVPAIQSNRRDGDPLLSMLVQLQEAANYSSPHSNESDVSPDRNRESPPSVHT